MFESEYTEWADKNNPMDVTKHGRILQNVLEDILEGKVQSNPSYNYIEMLQKLYGPKLYKCRIPQCETSSEDGFETSTQRQLHEDKHARPYKCSSEGCAFNEVGFATKAALQKHRRDYHEEVIEKTTRKTKNLEVLSHFTDW
jgi:hypothetical protein